MSTFDKLYTEVTDAQTHMLRGTYQSHIRDNRIASRSADIWNTGGSTCAFRETGSTFECFVADPYTSFVLLAADRETFYELAAHYEINAGNVGKMSGVVAHDESGRILMGVFDKSKSTLVHEIGHATFRVLHRAGVKASAADDEAFCYLQGKMFEAFERYI